MAPFVWGGAEELAANLVTNLRARGCEAELLRIPFKWDPFRREQLRAELDAAFFHLYEIERDDVFTIDRSLDASRFAALTGYVAPSWDSMLSELVEMGR